MSRRFFCHADKESIPTAAQDPRLRRPRFPPITGSNSSQVRVLAAGSDKNDNLDGWWEAIIVRVDDVEFLVRWRGYPNEPRASRSQEYIALLHPKITGG
ncbi:MAG: hypothetical protein ACREQT_09340 [Candidatus Binataceae bacterium]